MSQENGESLEWLKLKTEIGSKSIESEETGKEKLLRKVKENPLVPTGALLTVVCLSLGLYSLRKGDSKLSQLMMRGRILAQGFTVAALIGGLYVTASSKNNTK